MATSLRAVLCRSWGQAGMRAAAASGMLFVSVAALGSGACSSDSEDALSAPGEGSWTGTTSGTTSSTMTGTGSGTGTGTGTGTGNGYGGSGQGDPEDVLPDPPNDEDAGADADAAVGCEALDSSKPLVLYLSADDSNSMASPVHAREQISLGLRPPSHRIRTYEFLNYYRIQYPAPPVGQLALYPEMEPADVAGDYNLQIAVRSFDAIVPRRAMTITFVLDTSGSMSGSSIERERAVVRAVAKSLAAGDVVNAVVWSHTQTALLAGHVATGPDDPQVLALAAGLNADGSTDLNGGLVAGYALATEHYGPNRLNRLILVSDGGANTGITDEQLIAEHSEDGDSEGIYLVGVGTGPADYYNDLLIDTVTDEGRGAYVYVDSEDEAFVMFHERFDETMEVAARGVQVELTLPWYFQMEKFYGEEYSENPAEVEPQHLAPSDAMIFNQVLRACDPTIVDGSDPIGVVARWTTPLSYAPREVAVSMTVEQLLAAPLAGLPKGKAIVAYAEALKEGTSDALAAAWATVNALDPDGTDPELSEIAALLEAHPSFP